MTADVAGLVEVGEAGDVAFHGMDQVGARPHGNPLDCSYHPQ